MKHDELQRPALVRHILERVLVAEPDSPIAVFDHPLAGCLRAAFASTVQSQKDIARGHDIYYAQLVGVYDNSMNFSEVRRQLLDNSG